MPDVKISAGADPVTLVATDKVPMARSASTTAYAATMAELATYANGAYVPNYFTGTPSMDGSGAAGTAAFVARGDHVHPSDTSRLALAGGTMVGFLTLSGAPTANLHAATKLYVDGSAPVGGPYLPLAGGILTGALTPAQPAGLVGTTTNNNASAGSVGEYLSASLASGSAITLTTGTFANVTTLALTAGDWEVAGQINFSNSGNVISVGYASASNVTAGLSTLPTGTHQVGPITGTGFSSLLLPTGGARFLLAAPATAYLVALANFTTTATTAYGTIWARRMR